MRKLVYHKSGVFRLLSYVRSTFMASISYYQLTIAANLSSNSVVRVIIIGFVIT